MFFQKAILMDGAAMDRSLMRISHEILERNTSVEDICLVGIYRRGCSLARQIGENLKDWGSWISASTGTTWRRSATRRP